MTELVWTTKEFDEWIKGTEKETEMCQSVVELNLSNCNMLGLPPEIGLLTNLKILDISCNKFTRLDLNRLTNLTELYCSDNCFTTLEINRLTNLTGLYCSFNQLTTLEINQLTNLTELNCSFNRLTTLEINRLTNLTELYCSGNRLTTLEINQLTNLTDLYCFNNRLATFEICRLTNLTVLYCFNNRLTTLEISQLTNLTALNCSDNQLTTLEINQLTNLTALYCYNNQLTALEINQLTNLTALNCYNNQLTALEINQLTNLTALNCSRNQLTTLEIGQLTNLTTLYCSDNQLTRLPTGLCNLRGLTYFMFNNNLIDYIPPDQRRFINRIDRGQNLYNDSQSVHNHQIQVCVSRSIQNLINEKPTITDITSYIINDQVLTEQVKQLLFEYISDKSVHSTLNITFEELLVSVINRIEVNPDRDEIKRILNTEMLEAECKCFTGRISRLVNCLNGFDPLVSIQISDQEQISNVIVATGKRLLTGTYTVERHREEATKALLELGYSQEQIDNYVNYIE